MFTTPQLIIIGLGAALNVSIGTIVYLIKLPVYLDSIGTILVALLLAPDRTAAFLCAWAAGGLCLVVAGRSTPSLPWFAIPDVAIALVPALLTVGAAATFRARPLRPIPLPAPVLLGGAVNAIASGVV